MRRGRAVVDYTPRSMMRRRCRHHRRLRRVLEAGLRPVSVAERGPPPCAGESVGAETAGPVHPTAVHPALSVTLSFRRMRGIIVAPAMSRAANPARRRHLSAAGRCCSRHQTTMLAPSSGIMIIRTGWLHSHHLLTALLLPVAAASLLSEGSPWSMRLHRQVINALFWRS